MADIFDLTDVWNNAGTMFAAIRMNVTDTASQAGSMLLDLQVGGVDKFAVRKDGMLTTPLARLPELVAPSGSDQAGAAAITRDIFYITGGSFGQGVRLPVATAGRVIRGFNLGINTAIFVYPASGNSINGKAVNAVLRLRSRSLATFCCVVDGEWRTEAVLGDEGSPFAFDTTNGRTDFFDTQGRTVFFTNVGAMAIQGEVQCYNANAGGGLSFAGAANAPLARFRTASAPDIVIQPFNVTGNNWYTTMRWASVNAQANHHDVSGGAAGSPVVLGAAGSDTDIDILLSPKNAGRVRFGSHSALAAETVTGYVTIKDAGGTVRKLAVVS